MDTSAPSPDQGQEQPLPRQRVTIDQLAAMVGRCKRTLAAHRSQFHRDPMPEPAVEGVGPHPALYDWCILRPWLERVYEVTLPERFPGYAVLAVPGFQAGTLYPESDLRSLGFTESRLKKAREREGLRSINMGGCRRHYLGEWLTAWLSR